ncbi:uncharacterized protein F4822DRAFT_428806 [Hypoxylon trugodes]|uniref:uncharacterized protein n=1 Tax=Hypoxylon trugodes TaxID=326681 RepID=UPI0021960E0A|nr:uncharacterized protein F4822DRAFT_428806 [Hypoxylon trugodes]KAI1388183.1 hypothetical protein F4822DRAFT_428806 [Hypoxylon trugodes]
MLRSTRPFLTSSSRAFLSQKSPISSLPKPYLQKIHTDSTFKSLCSRPFISQCLPSIHKARYSTKTPSGIQHGRDPEEEKRIGQQKLEAHPEVVSTGSSVRHLYEPDSQKGEKPIKHGIRDDLETVKDTFALSSVPKEPYVLGLAGTLPYLATSLSTVYLSWDLNTEWPSSSSFVNNILISHDTARQLLGVIEPIQLGYGAIIISFLGAVHWGMEYAEKIPNRERMRFRYGLGVLAPIVAWPTLLMPMDFALTSQFAAFVMLYFADSRAATRAWAPSWYGIYRFVLTAIVGAAIVITLIGRMKVGDAKPRLSGLNEKVHDHRREESYSKKWEELEEQEREQIQKEKEEAEKKKKEEEKKAKEEAKKKSSEKDKNDENDKSGKEDKSGEKDKGDDKDDSKEKDKNSEQDKNEDKDQDQDSEKEKEKEKGKGEGDEGDEGKDSQEGKQKDEGKDDEK